MDHRIWFCCFTGNKWWPRNICNLPNDTQWVSRSAWCFLTCPSVPLNSFYPIICCLLAICLHSIYARLRAKDAEFKYDVIPLCMRIAKGMFFHQVFLRGIVRSFIYNIKIQKFHVYVCLCKEHKGYRVRVIYSI